MREMMEARVRRLMASGAPSFVLLAFAAGAQTTDPTPRSQVATGSIESARPHDEAEDIVVIGSRIRRAATDALAPVVVVDQQSLTDRGFVNSAQALNNVSSNNPALTQASGDGGSAGGAGSSYPSSVKSRGSEA